MMLLRHQHHICPKTLNRVQKLEWSYAPVQYIAGSNSVFVRIYSKFQRRRNEFTESVTNFTTVFSRFMKFSCGVQ